VGPQLGGIDRHLAALSQATTKWLEFEQPSKTPGSRDELLLKLAMEDEDSPEQPEVLSLIRESRLLGIPIIEGSIFELPFIFRLELNTVLSAEQEFKRLAAANIRQQVAYGEKTRFQ
jgi:hypothetical protein